MKKGPAFQTYLFVITFVLLLFSQTAVAIVAINFIDANVEISLENQLEQSTDTVIYLYNQRLEDLLLTSKVITSQTTFHNAIKNNNRLSLESQLENLATQQQSDFIFLVNEQNQIITTINGKVASPVPLETIIQKAQATNLPQLSTEYLSESTLQNHNPSIAQASQIARIPSLFQEDPFEIELTTGALAQVVVIPLKEEGQPLATLIVIDILNNDHQLVQTIQEITEREVTIYQKDVAISSSITTTKGNPYVGTLLVQEAKEKVLYQGQTFTGKVWGEKNWSRRTYVPIYNHRKEVIGALSSGIWESDFAAKRSFFQKINITQLFMVALGAILIISLYISFFISRHFNKSISAFIESIERIKKGDLDHGVNISSFKELNTLARHFNILIRYLRHRHGGKKK